MLVLLSMNNEDKQLQCKDCGKSFTFTAGEQKFFESKGFSAPSRCPSCRRKKRNEKVGPTTTSSQGGQANYEITCSKCSKTTKVPFKPRNTEGILCGECFEKQQKK